MPWVRASKDGPPWLIDGVWSYTKDGKPRQPGSLREQLKDLPEDWDKWPKGFWDCLDEWPYDDPDFDPLPFDESQLPKQ